MNFIACFRHPEQKIQFLYLLPKQIELLCENCVDENHIEDELLQINKLISINSLLQKPEMLFKKIGFGENDSTYSKIFNYNSSAINQKVINIEKQIQILYQQIQEQLLSFKMCVQAIEKSIKQFQFDYSQKFNFESLKQLLLGLVQSDDATNPDAIAQLKQKLYNYFFQFQIDNENQAANNFYELFQTSNSIELSISNRKKINQYKQQLEQLEEDQKKIMTSIFPPLQTLFQNNQLNKIINLVKERQKCEIQNIKLIYLGSRDGLNAKSFWSKVDGKKNLLMIFKSKSNYIFGGYSPCQWQQNLSYVQDNTNSSFLFSQTHDEIYPIVNNQYAIYCRSDYGPTFGSGNDMYIASDFQSGCSALGYSYKWDKFQNKKSNHLFGQETPNIMECEIFEITIN